MMSVFGSLAAFWPRSTCAEGQCITYRPCRCCFTERLHMTLQAPHCSQGPTLRKTMTSWFFCVMARVPEVILVQCLVIDITNIITTYTIKVFFKKGRVFMHF